MQSFDDKKITSGISGDLRQELRELELLDSITKMRYEGTLPDTVTGITRNELIHKFRQAKGDHFMPSNIPEQLQWSPNMPLIYQSMVMG